MNFRKKIDGDIYVVEEPTIRQNNAFLKLCIENKIVFSGVADNFDFGKFLTACIEEDLLTRMLQTMIVKEHSVWSAESVPLSVCEQLTESDMEEVFKIFFLKKKEWIRYFVMTAEKAIAQVILSAVTQKATLNQN